jgi:NAD(P)-dependent dehydrogenase (short-subunit alcohol dehydrogenase family)
MEDKLNSAKDISSMFSLEDKVALVSGASRGIGFAIASAYAKSGAKVVICSRKLSGVEKASEKIKTGGGKALAVVANVSIEEHRKELVKKAMKWAGKIDILVNNAGTNPAFGPLADVSENAWNKVFEVNLNASLFISQAVYHAWMGEHGGVIINISSAGGFHPMMGINAYNVTKAALLHLTKCLASEWGANGIRVNAIAPGILKTRLSEALWNNPFSKEAAKRYPLGRFGEVEEITGAALFLASDASSYITGHALVMDGGQLIQLDQIKLK